MAAGDRVWDCGHCGRKAIPENIQFCVVCDQPKEDSPVYIEQGADWFCGFCGTPNPWNKAKCQSCGGSRPEDQDSHRQAKAALEAKNLQEIRTLFEETGNLKTQKRKKKIVPLVSVAFFVAAALFLYWPRERVLLLVDKEWSREISIIEYNESTKEWVTVRTEYSSGTEDDPYWPEKVSMEEGQKEGSRSESLLLKFINEEEKPDKASGEQNTYSMEATLEDFISHHEGERYTARVSAYEVKEIISTP